MFDLFLWIFNNVLKALIFLLFFYLLSLICLQLQISGALFKLDLDSFGKCFSILKWDQQQFENKRYLRHNGLPNFYRNRFIQIIGLITKENLSQRSEILLILAKFSLLQIVILNVLSLLIELFFRCSLDSGLLLVFYLFHLFFALGDVFKCISQRIVKIECQHKDKNS